jgi:UDP-N-acetylmuramoylalanine--D-glutamate ligase
LISLAALPDHPYGVLGLGRTGLAACRALTDAGKTVWAWDDNAPARAAAEQSGIALLDANTWDFSAVGAVVLSPGIPRHFPQPHPIVQKADAAGVAVISDMELFAQALPNAVCVGVTGTNGKSTTTALIGHIFREAGRPVEVGGNLGFPVLDLTPLSENGVYIFEISSYQLDITTSLPLSAAILINIAPDHLDRHGGFDGYVASKKHIFDLCSQGGTAIIGVDDDTCRGICAELAKDRSRQYRIIPISSAGEAIGGVSVKNGWLIDGFDVSRRERVFELSRAAALPGDHNAQNAAAAYAVCRALGLDPADIAAAMATFPGLSHRQERVAVVRNIAYVNDSKATNPDAAARALACYDPIYWIVGGRAKDGGFDAVAPYLDRVRQAFCIGEAAPAIASFLESNATDVVSCGTLEVAVTKARQAAEADCDPNGVVLLSPMCASFDQFQSFEARGDAFRGFVETIQT